MNANNVPIIDLKKESLINTFQNYMGKSFSNDKMLRFLSAYNATLLAMTATKKEFTKEYTRGGAPLHELSLNLNLLQYLIFNFS